jgi:YidC/Oxa1 family membrane protein insertase
LGSLFGFITYPMELGLIWLAVTVGGAGIAIILFTIVVRLILSPLQITQLRNAKAMQRVQPLIKELQKKHGKDKQALTQATMALYKEHKVNPAMGCLPTLLQFPILIGLFYALLHLGSGPSGYPQAINWAKSACNGHNVATWHQWYQACYAVKSAAGTPESIFALFHAHFLWLSHGLGLPDPFYILPILAGVTQWIQSRMMLTKSTDQQQQMMNSMMNFMPLMIIFFALRYPSGLSLYWVTSTTIGILIQYKITGFGLLKPTLVGIPGAARALVSPRPSTQQRPRSGRPAENGARPAAAGEQNGHNVMADGTTDGSANGAAAVVRPRKKVNRARGGRSGGRRG